MAEAPPFGKDEPIRREPRRLARVICTARNERGGFCNNGMCHDEPSFRWRRANATNGSAETLDPRQNQRVTRLRAAGGSIVFLVVAPGVAGGLVPWLLVRGQSTTSLVWLQILGWVVLAAGAAVLIEAFGRFVVDGLGTPAPVAPPQKLVV